ncbi:MAG: DUF1700 domain-containing protein [Lachnospiraceae bacterium]|jgi:uncharacterized membrane protein|nr:DUF1700 domain-containing protein [Lachnospiraceae bacterium]
MSKKEFIEKLTEALSNDLDSALVRSNVEYYQGYINDEMAKGRSEEEITGELGDPWAIAQTVITGEKLKGNVQGSFTESNGHEDSKTQTGNSAGTTGFSGSFRGIWPILGILAAILLVVIVVFAILGSIVSALWPILPVLIVIFVIFRLFRRRN